MTTAFRKLWKTLLIDFFSVSSGPKKEKTNDDQEPLTIMQIYGKLSRRKLQKEWYHHNHYEIAAIFEDLNEEMKENIRLHGGEIEEPTKLTKSGISEINSYFNG